MKLFAEHGLHGVTTRMIADSAGVSEALLYRHFKGKEELYAALQGWCLKRTNAAADQLAALEPSTSTLVMAVSFLVSQILQTEAPAHDQQRCNLRRLLLSSLLEDGAFVRGFLDANFKRYVPRLVECLDAAFKTGDMVDKPRHAALRIWLTHHLPIMVANYQLPQRAVVDYGVSQDVLTEEVTRYTLRGLGLRDEAIRRHYNPKALALFLRNELTA